jgi:type I restriction enzyme, S subunit
MPAVIIYSWLKSAIGKEQLDSITIGSTQAALTISGLKQIVFKLPPKEIIEMAEEKLTAIYSKIEGNQKQTQTLEKLRDNLLPKLMSGEVRVEH